MSKNHIFLSIIILFLNAALYSQVIPVGSGSYTATFPGVDEAGRNGFPSGTPQVIGNALGKPVPTNDWWSSVVKENHASNLFNYPMTMKTVNSGLVVSYIPQGVIDDQEPIIVGVSGLNTSRANVADYSDWTVSFDWNEQFQVTTGIGMPFLYFTKGSSETAQVTINLGSVTVNNEMIIVENARNGADFAIYAPAGSTWIQSGSSYTSTLNGNDYWSMAMLPQNATNISTTATDLQKYAYVFPTNTTVDWNYDASTSMVTTDFTVQTEIKEGANSNVLMGLLPHQWGHLAASSPQPTASSYESIRGELKMLDGNTFSVENSFKGILPTLPYLSNYSDGFNLADLNSKVEQLKNDGLATWTDSYNEGQVMNRLIQTARIADEMGNVEARDLMIATVKSRLEDWLSAESPEVAFLFYYNDDWSALLGYPAGHGQDNNINDHHFHWGYFIHAAAFVEQFEPGWTDQWGDMVNHLVRDAASEDRNDAQYPFLRNFSPYAGHCWANGFATFPQGNDQESTSESMQFNSSLIHWGSITGNDAIRDLGIYLYTTEQTAIEEYWFDMNDRIFSPTQQYSLVSRVWGNSYDNGTFWTNDIEASYGIELYPIHGGSMYLGHNTAYAEQLWAEMEQNTGILNNGTNVNLWHDVMWKYLAFTDPEKAINLYNSSVDRTLKFGVSDAQTYYWLHSMNAMGKVDATVTADHPIAVAFNRNGEYTYAAHNYSDQEIEVTFSTGYVLTVPARSMATNRDVDISGTISSSFSTAYPGGSVDLSVVVNGGTATRVDFYQGNALLESVTTEPFQVTADQLSAGVYNYYAKVYDGADFGVTNIAEVVVGNQTPYGGIAHVIPGTIEAGHYDAFEGGIGQGISYFDISIGNNGDFRTNEYVDVAASTSEGATVGWISSGEWVEYTIDVTTPGLYSMGFRYASGNQSGGGPFHVELDGNTITGDISLSYTGDWDSWNTKTVTDIPLPAGEHILRLFFDHGEFNIGRMTFSFDQELGYGHPLANAGSNVVVVLPESMATLDGSQSSDTDSDLTYHWEQINGPSVINFDNQNSVTTNISNLVEGVYACLLTVDDGEYTDTDEVLVVVSLTGNSSPTLSINSPSANASFPQGDLIPISVTASDIDGEITLVEFYDGENIIGQDDTSPYSFDFANASLGTHMLSAKAIDDQGAIGTSATVSVSVEEVNECASQGMSAQQGAFSTGYISTFSTVGSAVTITFELLDTDKNGVVAYLWQESPFVEQQMEHVSGNKFRATVNGQTDGSTIRYGCKFAFAGGLAVTQYISYVVGSSCEVEATLVLSNAQYSIEENSESGAVVGTPNVSYTGDLSLGFQFVSGNESGAFTINSITGQIVVDDADPLDFEINEAFTLVVKVTDGSVSDEATIVVSLIDLDDNVLGLSPLEADIHMYPNPIKDQLIIDWADLKESKIYDLFGREVLSSDKNRINVTSLGSGTYIVIIESNANKYYQRMIVKLKE